MGRLKALSPPHLQPPPIFLGNAPSREFPPSAPGLGGRLLGTIRAPRDLAFPGGDFPAPPAGPLWDAEGRPPSRAKSGDGAAWYPGGGVRAAARTAWKRFLGERGGQAVSGRLIASGVERRRPAQPGGHCACAAAPPRPGTPPRVFLPVPRRPSRRAGALYRPGTLKTGLRSWTPGEPRGALGFEGTECWGEDLPGRWEAGPIGSRQTGWSGAHFRTSSGLKDVGWN